MIELREWLLNVAENYYVGVEDEEIQLLPIKRDD